ncbi:Uncharacterised protein [Mycobacteroides abscessus subsp. abscessus]|nr:Uncharacterised protein [Mycobacteroides abscessus subsp. abscessus]
MPSCHVIVKRVGVVVQPGDDDPRAGEPCIEIGVPVRDVHAGYAGQPDDLVQTEQAPQLGFHLALGAASVSIVVEHAAFGDDCGAPAVDFDGPALQDEFGVDGGDSRLFGDLVGDHGVGLVLLFVAPAVEVEIDSGPAAFIVDIHGSAVPYPQVVQCDGYQLDAGPRQLAGQFGLFWSHQH